MDDDKIMGFIDNQMLKSADITRFPRVLRLRELVYAIT